LNASRFEAREDKVGNIFTLSQQNRSSWDFPDFPKRYTITIIKVRANRTDSFVWDPETVVTITLESMPDKSTVVRVKENGKELNQENLKWVIENSRGWSNFLACLKAYLEYGIQLRRGAFEFMREK